MTKAAGEASAKILVALALCAGASAACSPVDKAGRDQTETVTRRTGALVAACSLEVDVVDSLGDANPPPACVANMQCSLRGAFQLAVDQSANGCGVVANLAAGTYALTDELTLPRGDLTLRGQGSATTVMTTTAPCQKNVDCECAFGAGHRIINAIGDGTAALSLALEGVTVRGGHNSESGDATLFTASGGIVVRGGRFTAHRVVIEDNRARGWGSGLGVYDSELVRITDSVIRDNINIQAVEFNTDPDDCRPLTVSGGLTGWAGGIDLRRVDRTEISHSAIIGNVGTSAGGIFVSNGQLTVQNSTFSGNRAGGRGGGILSEADVTRLYFNTFSENWADQESVDLGGSAFRISSGAFTAFGNIIAGNFLGLSPTGRSVDCGINDAAVTTFGIGYNIIGQGGNECLAMGDPAVDPLIGDAGDPFDPGLNPIPLNSTSAQGLRYGLNSASLAIDAYPASSALPSGAPRCPFDDQSHIERPGGSACDLGASELNFDSVGAVCDPGQTDYWCCTQTGNTTLEVEVDPALPDTEPSTACEPLSVNPAARCTLRGAFRLAALTADNGCTVVANLAAGTHTITSELYLPGGDLTLLGAGSASTTITTAGSTCIDDAQSCNQPSCSVLATHRLIEAISQFGAPLSLQLNDLTLKGGHDLTSGGTFSNGGGAILIDGGSLIANRAVIDDNRAFGYGAGISSIRSPLVRLTDCVVRNNINSQVGCNFTGTGGHTGLGGGLFAFGAGSVEIVNSAIVGNVGSQGGGVAAEGGGPLLIRNCTISGNVAAGFGGGLLSSVATTLDFNTIAFNLSATDNGLNPADKRGGGIAIQGSNSSIAAHGNILASNLIAGGLAATTAPDCNVQPSATVSAAAFNLIASGGRDCIALGDPSDPLIGSNTEFLSAGLDFNLPATPVTSAAIFHTLLSSSPALDAYPAPASLPSGAPSCPGTDQRRRTRPSGPQCDLGAIEIQVGPPEAFLPANSTAGCTGAGNCTVESWGVDLNTDTGYQWNVAGGAVGGSASLFFRVAALSGTRSMGLTVNGTQVAVITANATDSPRPGGREVGPYAVSLVPGNNVVALVDDQGTDELDVHYLRVESSVGYCGNGVCASSESCGACAQDCGPCGVSETLLPAQNISFCTGSASCTQESWGIDLNGDTGYRWVVAGGAEGGGANLFVKVASPTGTRAMGLLVNGSQVAIVSTNPTQSPRPSGSELGPFFAILGPGNNTIELADNRGTAELDVHHLRVTPAAIPSTPCAGFCANPVPVTWSGSYQGGNLGTGAVCLETVQPLAGGNCGNFAAGRRLLLNGVEMPCNALTWPSLPPSVNGGYCVQTTAGEHSWAFVTLW